MATPIGIVGGVAIAPEATYGTEGTPFSFLHGSTCTLGLRRSLITPSRVQRTAYTEKEYGPSFVDGEISGDWCFTSATMLPLLKALGSDSSGTVTLSGAAPTTASLSVECVMGAALSYKTLGAVALGLKIDAQPNAPVKYSVPFIGQSWAKDATPSTVSLPAESQITMPSTLGALSIGGTATLFRSLSLSVDIPCTGAERSNYAGSAIKQPVRLPGARVSGSIEVELDDSSPDSIAILDLFIAGTALGAITIGTTKIQIADARMIGDTPAWRPGIQTFPINFEADSMIIVVS